MEQDPIRVDAKDWTDGGYPINLIKVQRSAAVFVFCALGSIISVGLLLVGLLLDRMTVPWNTTPPVVSVKDPGPFWGSAVAWLLLTMMFLRATIWALSRVRREWKRALRQRSLHDPKC